MHARKHLPTTATQSDDLRPSDACVSALASMTLATGARGQAQTRREGGLGDTATGGFSPRYGSTWS